MDIEKTMSEVRQFLKEDSGEGTKQLLAQVEQEFKTMQDSLKRINSENKTKREKLTELQISNDEMLDKKNLEIGKLKKEIEALSDDNAIEQMQAKHETKISELMTDYETKINEVKTQNEKLLDSQKQLNEIMKKEVIADLTTISEHPNFEKIKSNIKLPEIKDNKFDFENYSDDDVLFTKNKLSEYKKIGLFETDGNIISPKVPLVGSTDDVDIVALAKSDPKAARQWLDKKRKKNPLFS